MMMMSKYQTNPMAAATLPTTSHNRGTMKTVETPGVHPSQYGGGAPAHPHSVGHGTTRHGYNSSRGYSVTLLEPWMIAADIV